MLPLRRSRTRAGTRRSSTLSMTRALPCSDVPLLTERRIAVRCAIPRHFRHVCKCFVGPGGFARLSRAVGQTAHTEDTTAELSRLENSPGSPGGARARRGRPMRSARRAAGCPATLVLQCGLCFSDCGREPHPEFLRRVQNFLLGESSLRPTAQNLLFWWCVPRATLPRVLFSAIEYPAEGPPPPEKTPWFGGAKRPNLRKESCFPRGWPRMWAKWACSDTWLSVCQEEDPRFPSWVSGAETRSFPGVACWRARGHPGS